MGGRRSELLAGLREQKTKISPKKVRPVRLDHGKINRKGRRETLIWTGAKFKNKTVARNKINGMTKI